MTRGLRRISDADTTARAERQARMDAEHARASAEVAAWAATQPGLELSFREFSFGHTSLTGTLDGLEFSSNIYGLSGDVYLTIEHGGGEASRLFGIAQWDLADPLTVRAERIVDVVRDYLRQQHCPHLVAERFCANCGLRVTDQP